MLRLTRAAALVAALSLLLAACGGDADPAAEAGDLQLVTDGVLTVCSDIPYEPFEFEDADSPIGYSGFDIELIVAIADQLDLDVEVIATGFEGLTSGATMAAGTCDLAISAMTITPDRAENVDFSDPYYNALQSLMVPEGSAIAGIGDLTDGVVGVQSGTTGEDYANENVPGAEIRSFENVGDLFVALEAGQIDSILQDLPVNAEYALNNAAEVVEEYDTDENYGIAMERGRPDGLVDAVNAALSEVRGDGTYDEIYEKYFPGA